MHPRTQDDVFIVIVKTDEEKAPYFIMCNDEQEGSVHAFKTERAALNFFEDGYARAHSRTYERSMSALVNFIFFQPAVLKVKGVKDIEKMLGKPPFRILQYSHVSGFYKGYPVDSKIAKPLWEKGEKPKIWDQEKMNKIWNDQDVAERMKRYET